MIGIIDQFGALIDEDGLALIEAHAVFLGVRGNLQGNRMNAIIVNPHNISFTINELHKGCSQGLYLCSFLSFWVSHGDRKHIAVGGRICRNS